MANKFDQAKLLMRARKLQKELQNEIISVEAGDGAVVVDITGDQKIKDVKIDPEAIDLEDIGQLEQWIKAAVTEAVNQSQKVAAEKMQPMMGALGNLGL
jgi:nucleoid-associated protein EbfC